MTDKAPSGGRFAVSFVCFGLAVFIAIILMLTAFVVWLSYLTGSFIASALIVGGFFAVLAIVIYLFSIREAVEQIKTQVETVYDVARIAKTGYEWVSDKVALFMKLHSSPHEK